MKEKFSFEAPKINIERQEKIRNKFEGRLERYEEIVSNRLEGEPKPKKVTLEIGMGNTPFFLNPLSELRNKKRGNLQPPMLERGELYIGLDIKEGEVRIAKQKYENKKPEIEKFKEAGFLVASGERLPIKEGVADEVVLQEVIDAPASYFTYKQRDFDPKRFLKILNPQISEFRDLPAFNSKAGVTLRDYFKKHVKVQNFEELDEKEQVTLEAWFWSIEQDRAEREAKLNIISEAKRALKDSGFLVLINHSTAEISEEFIDKYLLHDPTLRKLAKQEIIATRFGKKYPLNYLDIFQKMPVENQENDD